MHSTVLTSSQAASVAPYAACLSVSIHGVHQPGSLPVDAGFDELADAVRALTTHLGLPKANVHGASYGGSIALHLAGRHGDAVARLMLTGTASAFVDRPSTEVLRHHALDLVETDRLALARMVLDEVYGTDLPRSGDYDAAQLFTRGMAARLTPEHVRTVFTCRDVFVARGLAGPPAPPTCPVLAVTGEHDVFAPPSLCRQVVERCPDALFTTFKDCGHLAFLTRANDHARLMREFFLDELLNSPSFCGGWERFGERTVAV